MFLGLLLIPVMGAGLAFGARTIVFKMQRSDRDYAREKAGKLAVEIGNSAPLGAMLADVEYLRQLKQLLEQTVSNDKKITDALVLLFPAGSDSGILVARYFVGTADERQKNRFLAPVPRDKDSVLVLMIAPFVRAPVFTPDGTPIGVLELQFKANDGMKRAAWMWRVCVVVYGVSILMIIVGIILLWRRSLTLER